MSIDEVTYIIKKYRDDIFQYYGMSDYQDSFPYLTVEDSPYSDADDPELMAEFCSSDNEIVIYWKNMVTEELIIRTLIHEYQHYLQSPVWFTRYWQMGHHHNSHPYEIAAYATESDWTLFYEKTNSI